jgi:hypothetical protein
VADGDVRITGGAEFRALARDLRAAGDVGQGLRKRLRAAIVAEIKPMQAETRKAALAIPSRGVAKNATRKNLPGLRKSIAKSIRVRVFFTPRFVGARLEADPAKMPAGMGNLPAYMEGEKPNWRHPVYGHRNRKWGKNSPHPYFYDTVDPKLPGARLAIQAAAHETAAQIERGKI